MKLNTNTLDTLKNFADINTNILIKPGKELSTISTMRNIFAKAEITEEFTNEFGIYDLNEFLSVVTSLNKPELTLEDKFMTIASEGSKSKAKYFYSDPSVIVSPTKEVTMPEADVTFTLTESNLKELLKMAAILKTPDLALVGTNGGAISLTVCDKKNDTCNMKMFPGDYDVSVSSKSISHFQNKKMPIQYWIALEPDSSFTK